MEAVILVLNPLRFSCVLITLIAIPLVLNALHINMFELRHPYIKTLPYPISSIKHVPVPNRFRRPANFLNYFLKNLARESLMK